MGEPTASERETWGHAALCAAIVAVGLAVVWMAGGF